MFSRISQTLERVWLWANMQVLGTKPRFCKNSQSSEPLGHLFSLLISFSLVCVLFEISFWLFSQAYKSHRYEEFPPSFTFEILRSFKWTLEGTAYVQIYSLKWDQLKGLKHKYILLTLSLTLLSNVDQMQPPTVTLCRQFSCSNRLLSNNHLVLILIVNVQPTAQVYY